MNVFDAILTRKSIRRYESKPIEKEKLDKILEAGRLAPSANNEQSWKFMIVTDPQLLEGMTEVCDGARFVGEAPAVLLVCTDNPRTMYCGQPARVIDASIAMSFMILQATELGLGTCWIGHFDAEKARALLHVPADYQIVALTPLGYPAREGHPRARMALEDVVIHDRWK